VFVREPQDQTLLLAFGMLAGGEIAEGIENIRW
jgi:hypothetical protein